MRFMSGKNRKDFAKMAEQNEYIKEAYECLEKMSADERKRREYEERQKILWDHNSFMKSAKIIGMREGREEGREEGRMEGENRLNQLYIMLEKDGRMNDISRAMKEPEFLQALYNCYKKIAKRDVSRGNCRFSGRGCLDDTENL